MSTDILIAYYSWSGNTQDIAEFIASETGGELFAANPVKPYTTDYSACVAQARNEIRVNFRPELVAMPENKSYSAVFLGSPIWCGTMAPPLATFIDNFDFTGITVLPFYTHGGGGGGKFDRDIAGMCRNSKLQKSMEIYGSGNKDTRSKIKSWIKSAAL